MALRANSGAEDRSRELPDESVAPPGLDLVKLALSLPVQLPRALCGGLQLPLETLCHKSCNEPVNFLAESSESPSSPEEDTRIHTGRAKQRCCQCERQSPLAGLKSTAESGAEPDQAYGITTLG